MCCSLPAQPAFCVHCVQVDPSWAVQLLATFLQAASTHDQNAATVAGSSLPQLALQLLEGQEAQPTGQVRLCVYRCSAGRVCMDAQTSIA